MFERTPQQASLVADDRYVSQLSNQITHLRELIIVMVDMDRDTRRQSELMFRLLKELKAARLERRLGGTGAAGELKALPGSSRYKLDA